MSQNILGASVSHVWIDDVPTVLPHIPDELGELLRASEGMIFRTGTETSIAEGGTKLSRFTLVQMERERKWTQEKKKAKRRKHYHTRRREYRERYERSLKEYYRDKNWNLKVNDPYGHHVAVCRRKKVETLITAEEWEAVIQPQIDDLMDYKLVRPDKSQPFSLGNVIVVPVQVETSTS